MGVGLDQAGDGDLAATILDRHAGWRDDVLRDPDDAAVLDEDIESRPGIRPDIADQE